MKCANHPEIDAIGKCIKCSKDICEPCKIEISGEDQCKQCVAKNAEAVEKPQRSPGLAAFLSFIIAGAGQMYNGQVGKGILILFTAWLIIPWVYGILNAYSTANKINEGLIVPKKRSGCLIGFIVGAVGFFVFVAFLGLLAAIAIPNFIRAKMNAQEAAAKASVQTIVTACESYNMINKTYPKSLDTLSNELPPYIDPELGAGQKQGYHFKYQASQDGASFTITATPADEGASWTKTFTASESGEVVAIEPNTRTVTK